MVDSRRNHRSCSYMVSQHINLFEGVAFLNQKISVIQLFHDMIDILCIVPANIPKGIHHSGKWSEAHFMVIVSEMEKGHSRSDSMLNETIHDDYGIDFG